MEGVGGEREIGSEKSSRQDRLRQKLKKNVEPWGQGSKLVLDKGSQAAELQRAGAVWRAAFLLESASGHTPARRMQAPHKASLLLLLSQNCFKFKIEKTFICGSS